MLHDCFACSAVEDCTAVDTAFLAGIAFSIQFSSEAMKARLCFRHQEEFRRIYERSIVNVPPEDRR
jgi:hypothetical protein